MQVRPVVTGRAAVVVWMLVVGSWAIVSTGNAAAQSADTFLVWTDYDRATSQPAGLFELGSTGRVLATLATFPALFQPSLVRIAEDNQTLRIVGYFYPTQYPAPLPTCQILELRPGGSLVTLVPVTSVKKPRGLVQDADGVWYLMDGVPSEPLTLYRQDGSALVQASRAPGPVSVWGGVAWDPDSGQLVLRGMTAYSPLHYGYLRLDPATGAVTVYRSISQTINLAYAASMPVYDWAQGTLLDVYGDLDIWSRTARVDPNGHVTWLSERWSGLVTTALVPAGARTAGVAYWAFAMPTALPGGKIRFRALTPLRPDGTWLDTRYVLDLPHSASVGLIRKGSRHLAWSLATPPNGRNLHLSFPGEGGRSYVVGLSASGCRPGVALPDGRLLPINPDDLTWLALRGGMAGVLERTVGRLDAKGTAVIKVDTNTFGPALGGQAFWVAAVVLDPAAPSGVAAVTGPLRLDVRP